MTDLGLVPLFTGATKPAILVVPLQTGHWHRRSAWYLTIAKLLNSSEFIQFVGDPNQADLRPSMGGVARVVY